MAERLWWLDHQHPESRPDPRSEYAASYCNEFEVEMIHGLVQYLVNTNEYSFGDIAVLTPYNGQLVALNERLSTTCSIWLSQKDRDTLEELSALPGNDVDFIDEEKPNSKSTFEMSSMLRLATIDNFQGEEAKIVILSTVRSNTDDKVGFLKTPNRINVACSRAKHGFYIIGNSSLMRNVGMWRAIVDLLFEKGKIGPIFLACCSRHPQSKYEVRSPEDFGSIPACDHSCYSILDCGHLCKQKCHPRTLHGHMACTDSCKLTLECGHKCRRLCSEPCGECLEDSETVKLSCGHQYTLTCAESKPDDEPQCNTKLEPLKLPCGHQVDRYCHLRDTTPACDKQCQSILSCGHRCSGLCSDCQAGSHSACTGACGDIGDCGHGCPLPCHIGPCPPCEVLCESTCEHGAYKHKCSTIQRPCMKACRYLSGCPTLCCLPCGIMPASKPCNRLLRCGHLCASLVDEVCSNGCAQCLTGQFPEKLQIVLPCSHTYDVQAMDEFFSTTSLFNIKPDGVIESSRVHEVSRKAALLRCPTCQIQVDGVRRYSLISKTLDLRRVLADIYFHFGHDLNRIMYRVYKAKSDLKSTRQAFRNQLGSGPLSGKTNEYLIKTRANMTHDIQADIASFRGKRV